MSMPVCPKRLSSMYRLVRGERVHRRDRDIAGRHHRHAHHARAAANQDAAGGLVQQTEDSVGPYLLHDFFLFHVVRYGAPPRKVFFLARRAFDGMFDSGYHFEMAARVLYTSLRATVQTVVHAGRPQGGLGGAVAARRLAHAQRRFGSRCGWPKSTSWPEAFTPASIHRTMPAVISEKASPKHLAATPSQRTRRHPAPSPVRSTPHRICTRS